MVCIDLDISVGKTSLTGTGGAKIGILRVLVSLGPNPTLVSALIWNVYSSPGVRPVMVPWVSVGPNSREPISLNGLSGVGVTPQTIVNPVMTPLA